MDLYLDPPTLPAGISVGDHALQAIALTKARQTNRVTWKKIR